MTNGEKYWLLQWGLHMTPARPCCKSESSESIDFIEKSDHSQSSLSQCFQALSQLEANSVLSCTQQFDVRLSLLFVHKYSVFSCFSSYLDELPKFFHYKQPNIFIFSLVFFYFILPKGYEIGKVLNILKNVICT